MNAVEGLDFDLFGPTLSTFRLSIPDSGINLRLAFKISAAEGPRGGAGGGGGLIER